MKLAVAGIAVLFLSLPARSEEPRARSAKEQDIRRLLAITGADKLGVQVATQMLRNLRSAMKGVPETFLIEFEKELHPEELIDVVVPVYDRRFSHDEIKQLIELFQTPIGKKYIAELPALSADAMQAGQQWGQTVAQRALAHMQERESSHEGPSKR